MVEGLDLAVMKMKEGERALVSVAPQYGFGGQEGAAQPLASVPAGSALEYDVTLHSFVKVGGCTGVRGMPAIGGGWGALGQAGRGGGAPGLFAAAHCWPVLHVVVLMPSHLRCPPPQAKDTWEMEGAAEKLEAAAARKDKGNAAFKAGQYAKAVKRYDAALQCVE